MPNVRLRLAWTVLPQSKMAAPTSLLLPFPLLLSSCRTGLMVLGSNYPPMTSTYLPKVLKTMQLWKGMLA